MAVGESGAAFVECKDIVFVAVQVEGQGAGEIAPEQAVHEKLADLPGTRDKIPCDRATMTRSSRVMVRRMEVSVCCAQGCTARNT